MRLLVVALALVLTLVYFTFGLRLGYVTLTPTYMFNATGTNHYSFEAYEPGQIVGVRGSCDVRSGSAVFRLLNERGEQVAGQSCPKGTWSLTVQAPGDVGRYFLNIDLDKFSGKIDVQEARGSVK